MLDFGALPPEINSARMYAGPGSGPMLAAASAWDGLAAQLELYGTGYSAVISELQSQSWSGGASIAMATAAAPYVAWATATAAQAEQAAGQARAAAAAYEAAFAATVPPAVVAANRLQLAVLVATNFFGQNTPAIAATEAAYAEMWAQDAAAMYGYAASSSAAATLTPFNEPPQTTNPTGQPAQSAAVAQAAGALAGHTQSALSHVASALPQQLQTLSAAGSSGSSTSPGASLASSPYSLLLTAAADFNQLSGTLLYPSRTLSQGFSAYTGMYRSGVQAAKSAAKAAGPRGAAGATTSSAGGVGGDVLVSVNTGNQVGRLSVPQSWASRAPATGPPAQPVASTGTNFRALPAWATNPPAPANHPEGVPALGPISHGAERRTSNAVFRMRDRRYRIPRPAAGG